MSTAKSTEMSVGKSALATCAILSFYSAAFAIFNSAFGWSTNIWISGLHGVALGGILALLWSVLSACHRYSIAHNQQTKDSTAPHRPLATIAACASVIYAVCVRLYELSLFAWLFQSL